MHGIYIHIPFCVKKCNYCDFASYPDRLSLQDEYISSLIKEMETRRGLKVNTVYIGGGTPSVLSEINIKKLLDAVKDIFVLSDDTEFTMEVNPGTVSESKARLMRLCGVNRVSIGSQSFVDSELLCLGRIHSAEDTVNTYRMLRKEGFDNISLDLMYALPGQTIDSLKFSVNKLIELNPEHISCYGLKFEEGTPFYKMLAEDKISEADEEVFANMYEYICRLLKDSGYTHYEFSNFAKEGMESRHNLKYWKLEDYIGFGVSASSCEGYRRYTHSSEFDEYLSGYKLNEDYTMTKEESMSEFIILGLRVLNSGADKEVFKNKYDEDIDRVFANELVKVSNYIYNDNQSIRLKEENALVSNFVMCEFIK